MAVTFTTASSQSSVVKRLQKELCQLMLYDAPGISAFPQSEVDLFNWWGTIEGPPDTPYANLRYKISLQFPANYPYSPPSVKFITPMFHPNVAMSGDICLDILKEEWSAIYNVQTILISLQSLLNEPNNSSPLNGYAASLWDNNQEEYKVKVVDAYKDLFD